MKHPEFWKPPKHRSFWVFYLFRFSQMSQGCKTLYLRRKIVVTWPRWVFHLSQKFHLIITTDCRKRRPVSAQTALMLVKLHTTSQIFAQHKWSAGQSMQSVIYYHCPVHFYHPHPAIGFRLAVWNCQWLHKNRAVCLSIFIILNQFDRISLSGKIS